MKDNRRYIRFMKRFRSGIFLFFSFVILGSHTIAFAAEGYDFTEELHAQSAVLIDGESGRVLYGKNENERRPMASTTKIMTCILILENVALDEITQVSKNAQNQPKVHLGMEAGEQFYIRDLLYSLMLESHNDTAVALAEHMSGSVKDFAKEMNQKATQLGLKDTHFITPNGLDASDDAGIHSTTAKELAMVMKYCIQDSPQREEFVQITGTPSYQFSDVSGTKQYQCTNHNAFLNMMEGAVSGKTGFTGDAGYCYVGALEREGKCLIVALLGCGWPNNKSYKWEDTRKLMDYGLTSYVRKNIWKEIDLPKVKIRDGIPDGDHFTGTSSIKVRIKDSVKELPMLLRIDEEPEVNVILPEEVEGRVRKGTMLGKVQYLLNGTCIGEWEIVAEESRDLISIGWCIFRIVEEILK